MNSFWLSGCGVRQASDDAAVDSDARLRRPLLEGDWAAWSAAWRALDAGPVARLLDAADARGAAPALTLCGERDAQRFAPLRAVLVGATAGPAGEDRRAAGAL